MPDDGDRAASPRGAASQAAIDAAIDAIGSRDDQDWVITPAGHAVLYADAAPSLAAVLRSSAVVVVAQRFEALDARALEDQRTFNTTSSRARVAVFCAAIASALLLAGGGLSGTWPTLGRGLIAVAAVGAVVAGALATMWIQRVKQGQLLERWMTARAEAETARLRYFELVADRGTEADSSLLLEYFRRYQLDVQRRYYGDRSGDHRKAADRALGHSTWGVAGGSIFTGLASTGMVNVALTGFAAVGLAGQAWGALAANEEATAQNRRNAERYGRTRLALDRIYERLDEVRAAVAGGHREVLTEFVQVVQEQLSLEHRQWLEEMHGAGTAIGRLEELLSRYRDEGKASGTGAAAAEGGT
jgi:hypothetical protein